MSVGAFKTSAKGLSACQSRSNATPCLLASPTEIGCRDCQKLLLSQEVQPLEPPHLVMGFDPCP